MLRYIAENFRKDIYLVPENIEKIYGILFSYPQKKMMMNLLMMIKKEMMIKNNNLK